MVSLGDTAISLHIHTSTAGGGGAGCSGSGQFWNLERKLEFSIWGRGVLGKVRFGLWEEFRLGRGVLGKVRLGLWEEFQLGEGVF